MLYFARRPDAVFTAILQDALEELRHLLTDPAEADELWRADYSSAAKCFPLPLAVDTLDRLLAASQDSITVYRITDYHWLLLYACLKTYCDIHNDYAAEAAKKRLSVGPYEIGEIDFNALVDGYFWDVDFLVDATTGAGLGPEGRQQLGVSAEAFGLAQQLVPHPEELTVESLAELPWRSEAVGQAPEGPLIPQYPPTARTSDALRAKGCHCDWDE